MGYNDLINVSFEDAVLHADVDNSDVLGVILPYFWGPSGEINIFSRQEFFEAYPEFKRSDVVMTNISKVYGQIKSYFNNGGSRVAVFRPESTTYGEDLQLSDAGYVAFKYDGLPPIDGVLTISIDATDHTLQFLAGTTVVEEFNGWQVDDPVGIDDDGDSTYLPIILEQKSQYLRMVDFVPTAIPTTSAYTPAAATETLEDVFGVSDSLVATQFLTYNSEIDDYHTSVFFTEAPDTGSSVASRFNIPVKGKEQIKVFGVNTTISTNAGVAGAYAKVAKETHLNQIASAKTYGQYVGTLVSNIKFSQVLTNMKSGIVSVYNSTTGPQIFGTNNAWTKTKPDSYFAKCNVSRVLAAILRQIIPLSFETIHTDTAANPITRKVFATALQEVINGFISTQDLQSDSLAICDGTNNSDAQTRGGKKLNIALKLHFIGLVETVDIKVIATDSSVTVNF